MKQSVQKVSIVMGSDSDAKVMQQSSDMLTTLGVPYDINIISAHRQLMELVNFVNNSVKNGTIAFIAGAGMSAALPGVIAALTVIPVIGVPLSSSASAGNDSIFSVLQMPPGVPVATMALNGAKNAGIYAAQIYALKHPDVSERLLQERDKMARAVKEKNEKFQEVGIKQYIANMKS
jgi:5-(carboxyamino)imidazole ribonucleotide mutase